MSGYKNRTMRNLLNLFYLQGLKIRSNINYCIIFSFLLKILFSLGFQNCQSLLDNDFFQEGITLHLGYINV